jgi:hypothetical protein
MVPNDPTTRACESALAAHERFVELLCADEELLRAEFDAIIAAEWPDPPPVDPDCGADADRSSHPARQRRAASAKVRPGRPTPAEISGWTRQRSPPTATQRPERYPDQNVPERQVIATHESDPTR